MKKPVLLLVCLCLAAVAHGQDQPSAKYKNVDPNDTFRFSFGIDLRQFLHQSFTVEGTYKLHPRLGLRARTGATYHSQPPKTFETGPSTSVGGHFSLGLQWFDYGPRNKRESFSQGIHFVGAAARYSSDVRIEHPGGLLDTRYTKISFAGGVGFDLSWIVRLSDRVYMDWSFLNLYFITYQGGPFWDVPIPSFGTRLIQFSAEEGGWTRMLTHRPRLAFRYRFNLPGSPGLQHPPNNG